MAENGAEQYVVSKFDYKAQETQELSITKNERLTLLDDSRNWWKVLNGDGRVGYVPSNYVRKENIMDKVKGIVRCIPHLPPMPRSTTQRL